MLFCDKVKVQESFDGRLYGTGRLEMVALDKVRRGDALHITVCCNDKE